MPKIFNDLEKTMLRNSLISKGKDLFIRYGLKKTSITDLTKAVGIAQGTFYGFFGSKEELFFEILEHEQQLLQERLFQEIPDSGKITKEILKRFLTKAFELVEENPFISQLYLQGEYEMLVSKIPPEKLEEHMKKDSDVSMLMFRKWQSDGTIIEKDPEIIAGVFRSLFLLSLHKKEIGENIYKGTMELLIELIAFGLIKEEDK